MNGQFVVQILWIMSNRDTETFDNDDYRVHQGQFCVYLFNKLDRALGHVDWPEKKTLNLTLLFGTASEIG